MAICLNELKKECALIASSRKQDMTPTGIVKHLATEVVELQESLGYRNEAKIGEELADCVICCLTLSTKYNIDVEKCITDKIKYNLSRA
jgi:NTP pyrophosphatase (non-canonical NTP hydrolase)